MIDKLEKTSNIIDDKTTEGVISYTLEVLKNSLSKSLGPYGSNTIIEDMYKNHSITKDGYTIFKALNIDNEISRTILDIIKKISYQLVSEVGDASTSSIIVSAELYKELKSFKPVNYAKSNDNIPVISPKELVKILDIIEDFLVEKIKETSKPITNENIKEITTKIATVSNNNDYYMGNIIAEIYEKIGVDSFIVLDKSKTSKDHYKINEGYEFKGGCLDSKFFESNMDSITYEDALLFITENDITNDDDDMNLMVSITGYAVSRGKPLVIIAKSYHTDVMNFFKINKNRNLSTFKVVPVCATLSTENQREILKDLSVYTDCEVYDKYDTPHRTNKILIEDIESHKSEVTDRIFGKCKSINIDGKTTRIIPLEVVIEEDEWEVTKFEQRCNSIKTQINNLKSNTSNEDNDMKIFELQQRYNRLKGKIAILYIGGETDIEKENKYYLADDAVHAVRSAIKNGYIIGGNLTIPMILNDVNMYGDLYTAIDEKYLNVLNLSEIDKYSKMKTIEGIIDSVIKAFKSSFLSVLQNKYYDESYCETIMSNCIKRKSIYNLLNNTYESIDKTSVINSSDTDIQMLHAIFSIIGLLITSNQFITMNSYPSGAFDDIANSKSLTMNSRDFNVHGFDVTPNTIDGISVVPCSVPSNSIPAESTAKPYDPNNMTTIKN